VNYNFTEIEKKWQRQWKEQSPLKDKKPMKGKFYCVPMFPYPSGAGLHVGHWRSYVLSDIYARLKWLQGFDVLQPMGWDAFGLPAENDAIKKGIHPAEGTAKNIAHFKEQLYELGALYDWDRELNTTDPSYYKWTQWIFLKLFNAGLAYQTNAPINWCPSCLTGLANEEVVLGACERCGTIVEEKQIRQWVLKITDYAEKLLSSLDKLDWPEKVKLMQRNWIGKSDGLIFYNPVKDSDLVLETFSAHFEAFTADTFIVIAPEHPILETLLKNSPNKFAILSECEKLIEKRKHYEGALLEGVFTGYYAIDPYSKIEIPIWIAGFAIANYGTGMIRCSAHDERDFAFAKKYDIPLKVALVPEDPIERGKVENFEYCYTAKDGILTEPKELAGKKASDVRQDVINFCVKHNLARIATSYKLRDWIFSRQRYWGEPIPLVHCVHCGVVPVPEEQLPVTLPDVKNYQPSGTGESPLATISDWVNTICPRCTGAAKRETNTMPQWAGSCWYFLRYPDPFNDRQPWTQENMQYWLPVDLYVGGIEHAILHLLYARFWVKVLFDQKLLPFDEPFTQLFNQGMVLKLSEKTGLVEKMSKSKGNVVNPDDIVTQHGADVLRMYILFMGPPELDCQWQDSGIEGVSRFIRRFFAYISNPKTIIFQSEETKEAQQILHRFMFNFQERLEQFKPNTAIAAFMEFLNDAEQKKLQFSKESIESILVLLSIVAPHTASELLETSIKKQLADCHFPEVDQILLETDNVTIVIQVNGKMRATITCPKNKPMHIVTEEAKEKVEKYIEGKNIVKIIIVPDKLVNFVIKE
jgi:leucyl-tRNA synthetase